MFVRAKHARTSNFRLSSTTGAWYAIQARQPGGCEQPFAGKQAHGTDGLIFVWIIPQDGLDLVEHIVVQFFHCFGGIQIIL